MARLRLILAFIAVLTVAAAASLGLGLGVSWLIGRMHCEGEQLSCNIDDAIGAYGTLIWAGASVIVFGISMLFRNKRIALIVVALALMAPLVVFVFGDLVQGWRYVGTYPYADFRSFISKFAGPATTVLVQYLILRIALTRLMG